MPGTARLASDGHPPCLSLPLTASCCLVSPASVVSLRLHPQACMDPSNHPLAWFGFQFPSTRCVTSIPPGRACPMPLLDLASPCPADGRFVAFFSALTSPSHHPRPTTLHSLHIRHPACTLPRALISNTARTRSFPSLWRLTREDLADRDYCHCPSVHNAPVFASRGHAALAPSGTRAGRALWGSTCIGTSRRPTTFVALCSPHVALPNSRPGAVRHSAIAN